MVGLRRFNFLLARAAVRPRGVVLDSETLPLQVLRHPVFKSGNDITSRRDIQASVRRVETPTPNLVCLLVKEAIQHGDWLGNKQGSRSRAVL